MNTKLLSTFLTIAMTTSFAFAQVGVKINTNADISVKAVSENSSGTDRGEIKASVQGNATSSAKRSEKAMASSTNATSSNKGGSSNGEDHRSVVANFVHSLLVIAGRSGGIGAQVRAIAQVQNDTASSTDASIVKIESRGKFRTFLFGSDYKSIGELRSGMVKTQTNLDNLQKVIARTTDTSIKAELEVQNKILMDEQTKLDAFVKAHEDSFSLFGWLRK